LCFDPHSSCSSFQTTSVQNILKGNCALDTLCPVHKYNAVFFHGVLRCVKSYDMKWANKAHDNIHNQSEDYLKIRANMKVVPTIKSPREHMSNRDMLAPTQWSTPRVWVLGLWVLGGVGPQALGPGGVDPQGGLGPGGVVGVRSGCWQGVDMI